MQDEAEVVLARLLGSSASPVEVSKTKIWLSVKHDERWRTLIYSPEKNWQILS